MTIASLAFAAAAVTAGVAAFADGPEPTVDVERAPDGAILHRRLPAPAGGEAQTNEFIYDPVVGGSLPSELRRDGQTHPAPDVSVDAEDGEAVYSPQGVKAVEELELSTAKSDSEAPPGAGGPPVPLPGAPGNGGNGGDPDGAGEPAMPGMPDGGNKPGEEKSSEDFEDPRNWLGDRAKPDRSTQKEGRLDYHTVFDPSVVPFKRNRALNGVTRDYELVVERGRLRDVEVVGNRIESGREVFWGTVLLEAEAGQPIPLPSVAPDSRILSYEVAPETKITFHKDAADNFYVTAGRDGRLRLVFVMDAPTTYFGRELPEQASLADVPGGKLRRLPREVRRAARELASEQGFEQPLHRAGSYAALLRSLVAYFRGFVPGDPPPPTEDIYLELARGRTGVCRHRAFTFVVTANALGIPARYVFNEAHVFAEVYVPGRRAGWMRVDLGGGAEELVVHAGQDKVRHQPRARDPLPKPPGFARPGEDGNAAGATRVTGMPPQSRKTTQAPHAGGNAGDPRKVDRILQASVRRAEPRPGARPTVTTLALDAQLLFRGERTKMEGTVAEAGGRAVAEGTVQVLLLDAASGRPVRLLGTSAVDTKGRWTLELTFPEEQAPGSYEIVAEYMGGADLAPSVSE